MEYTGVALDTGNLPSESVQPKAFFVLGMHRSGTSALTRLISLLGARLPEHIIPAIPEINHTGFWESIDLVDLNEEILVSGGSHWDDVSVFPAGWYASDVAKLYREKALGILRRDFTNAPFFVLKDPRICRLVPFWTAVLEEFGAVPAFIFALRNPLEVANSLKVRDGFTPAKSHLLWLRHMLDAELQTRGYPRSFITYDTILKDWRSVASKISHELGVDWPRMSHRTAAEIESFLSPKHQHYQFSADDLRHREEVPDAVKDSFTALSAAAEGDFDCLTSTLDKIHEELENADGLYGLLVADHRFRLDEAEDGAKPKKKGISGRIAELEEELQERFKEIEQLGANLVAAHQKVEVAASLGDELSSTHQKAQKLGTELEKQHAVNERQLEELSDLRPRLEALTSQNRELSDEVKRLEEHVSRLEAKLAIFRRIPLVEWVWRRLGGLNSKPEVA